MHDFQMHAFPLTFLGLKPKNSMDLKVNIIAADDIAFTATCAIPLIKNNNVNTSYVSLN